MIRNSDGDSRGGEDHLEEDGDPHPPLPPLCQTHSVSVASAARNNSVPLEHQPQCDRFVESTLRSYCVTPASGYVNELEDFMRGLLNEVEKIVKFRILNPFLPN